MQPCADVSICGKASLGLVLANGFSTAKGQLFRSILFPKKIDFKFYRDSYRVLAILSGVALIAFVKRLIDGFDLLCFTCAHGPRYHQNLSLERIIVQSADLITIAGKFPLLK
jgi:magnesium-transporting ATPase (P-type)